jgi:hypothetical protein
MDHLPKTGDALALLLGATIPAQASKTSFECPEPIDEATPEKRAEIQKLLLLGNAMDNPGRLNASIDALRRLGLSKTLIMPVWRAQFGPRSKSKAAAPGGPTTLGGRSDRRAGSEADLPSACEAEMRPHRHAIVPSIIERHAVFVGH